MSSYSMVLLSTSSSTQFYPGGSLCCWFPYTLPEPPCTCVCSGAYRLNLLLMCSSANTWYMFLLTLHWTCQEPSTELVLVLWILSCNVKGWPHLIHGWLHLGLRSTEVPLWRSPTWTKQPLWFRGKFTLKVAKASEAISNVDSSTYLKKSLNWLEKRMILASGSCRIHSLSIIPQRKAICGASYLKHKEDKAEELSH